MTWPFVQDAIPIMYYGNYSHSRSIKFVTHNVSQVKSNLTLEALILPTAKRKFLLLSHTS